MPSEARKSLDDNLEDIRRLLALHATIGGKGKDRSAALQQTYSFTV
jgi:hypothetical protein